MLRARTGSVSRPGEPKSVVDTERRWRSSLDVAVETLPQKIGAVPGVPYEVVFGGGRVASCHGREF